MIKESRINCLPRSEDVNDIIMPIESHFTSPVVLCHKNNGKSVDNPDDEMWMTGYIFENEMRSRSTLNFRFQ